MRFEFCPVRFSRLFRRFRKRECTSNIGFAKYNRVLNDMPKDRPKRIVTRYTSKTYHYSLFHPGGILRWWTDFENMFTVLSVETLTCARSNIKHFLFRLDCVSFGRSSEYTEKTHDFQESVNSCSFHSMIYNFSDIYVFIQYNHYFLFRY